jgi:hypothetical protein
VKEISKADVAWIVLQAQICVIVTRSRKTAARAFVESECGQTPYLPLGRVLAEKALLTQRKWALSMV